MMSLLVAVFLSVGANPSADSREAGRSRPLGPAPLSIAVRNNTPAWRESLLVLSTGRAPYRPLYGAAIENVSRDAPASILYLAEMMDASSTREWMALYQVSSVMGPRAGAALLLAIARAQTDTSRWPLLYCLGISGDTRFASAIEPYSASADRRVRAAAVAALGDFGLATSVSALKRAIKDTEVSVRRIAADSLGRISKKFPHAGVNAADDSSINVDIRKALEEAARDSDPWVRRNARKAL